MIPKRINNELDKLERCQYCECCGARDVQRHHALQYAKKSMQEVFAIRALCYTCHMGNSMKPIRKADLVSKINAIEEGMPILQKKYSKRTPSWKQELQGYKHELSQLKEKEMETLKAKLNGYI